MATMQPAKGTFNLQPSTLKELQKFSDNSGISQSALVDTLVAQGLDLLRREWKPFQQVLSEKYASKGQRQAYATSVLTESTQRRRRRNKRS